MPDKSGAYQCGLCERIEEMTQEERMVKGWELWSDGVLGSVRNSWMCPECIRAMHRVESNRKKWFQ